MVFCKGSIELWKGLRLWKRAAWVWIWALVHACSLASIVAVSLWHCGLQPSRLLCPWTSPGEITGVEWVAVPSSRGSSQPRIKPASLKSTCIGRQILNHQCHLEAHIWALLPSNLGWVLKFLKPEFPDLQNGDKRSVNIYYQIRLF